MASEKIPATQAIRAFKKFDIAYTLHAYKYEDKGGTGAAARALHLDEHMIIKTLVMEDESGNTFLLLMHGDREVSTKNLARSLGAKRIMSCDPLVARRYTGYLVGGISPFGTKKTLNIYAEASIRDLPEIYINAGRRGLLAGMSPEALQRSLNPVYVKVAK